jgi:hypothetical protein
VGHPGGQVVGASSENRESEFRESREQVHQTSRNRDMRFPDSVWATLEDRWQVKGPSEDQRIGNQTNRYSRERRIGEIPKGNPDAESEPSIRWDACQEYGGSRGSTRVGILAIGKSEFLRTRKLRHRKSRNPES